MTIPQQPADQNPGDRPDSARQEPARFAASAVDLQQLKNRAQASAGGANTAGLANSVGTGATGHTGNAHPDRGTGTQIPAYFEVSEHNFETDVVRRSAEVPVVVLLGTSRAAGSDEMKRNFEELVVKDSTLGKIIFGYVDADKNPAIVQAFRAEAVPTVVALGQGQPLTQFQGVQPVEVLQQWVDALIQQIGPKLPGTSQPTVNPIDATGRQDADSEIDPRHDAAEQALARGDYGQAREHYDAILEDNPDDKQADLALKTVEVIERFDPANRSGDAVQDGDAEPHDVDKQLDAADAEVLAGVPEKAFARLISTMKLTAGADKDRLRTRVISLFELFDPADPRVKQARTDLASALF